MKKRIYILILIIVSIAVLMSGCTQDIENSSTPQDTSYTVTDSQGTEITFSEVPITVISLAPSITEIIFALERENKLVARTDWCNYPDAAANYTSVGNIDQPDVEKIILMQPDVVLLSEITKKEIALQIKDAGIPFFVIDNEESFEGAYMSIEMVGAILGAETKATEIIEAMKVDINYIIDKVAGAKKPTVYYVMGYGEYGDFTAGKGTFISYMIDAAGGTNVADDTEGWTYSVEKIIEHNPDILLCSLYAPPEGLKTANGYKTLSAVKEDKMYVLNDDTLQRLGPRLSEAFADMAKAIHPELFE